MPMNCPAAGSVIKSNIRRKCTVPLQLFTAIFVLASPLFFSYTPLQFSHHLFPSIAWGASGGVEGNGDAEEGQSEYYQYTDRDGVMHFVDGIEKIPRGYRNKMIVRKEKPANRETTGVDIVDKQIRVPVDFRYGNRKASASLILDTGASITCMTEEFASSLGIDLEGARVVSMGMADGSMVDIHVTMVDSVSVGDRTKSPFKIGILPSFKQRPSYDGYLGLDFLGAFQHRIDFQNSLIRWQ
jgi:hypothetical protein